MSVMKFTHEIRRLKARLQWEYHSLRQDRHRYPNRLQPLQQQLVMGLVLCMKNIM